MRYITRYEEYPIYEAADGGYYYAGNQIVESEKMSKHKAKKEIEKLWEEAKAWNLEVFGEEEPSDTDEYGNRRYPWIRIKNNWCNGIKKYSKYIGEGESYIIERCKGSETKGWHPYC